MKFLRCIQVDILFKYEKCMLSKNHLQNSLYLDVVLPKLLVFKH